MDAILDDLIRIARRCERAAKRFDADPLDGVIRALIDAANDVGRSWSGSWFGYHATTYLDGLRPAQPGEIFDTLRGRGHAGEWAIYDFDAVKAEVIKRAGVTDVEAVDRAARAGRETFREAREGLLPIFDAILAGGEDRTILGLRDKVAALKGFIPSNDFLKARVPKSSTHDSLAGGQGVQAPPHLAVECWALESSSPGVFLKDLAGAARHAAEYLRLRCQMKGKTVARTDGKVFIGHGRSPAWEKLRDFLRDTLELDWDEFNRESVAGLSTKERLEEMLESACFAFLVMTAEDEQADGSVRARENVVHEAGLFQGRCGFRRAIILLEEGCTEFSNVHGIGQIRFPKGNVLAETEKIRAVLSREKII